MRIATRLLAWLSVLIIVLGCGDEPRIGIVDVQQAFQRSPLVMVSAHRIKGDLGGTERELKKRGRALAQMRMELEHGTPLLDAAQREQARTQIDVEAASLAEAQRQYRMELATAQQRRGDELIAMVEEVAREVARQEGVTLLLRKQGLLYTGDGALYTDEVGEAEWVDLTEQVARALLEKINPTEIPAPAAAPVIPDRI
jgi:Skp family chaperone for outer membrane proteins